VPAQESRALLTVRHLGQSSWWLTDIGINKTIAQQLQEKPNPEMGPKCVKEGSVS